MSHKPPYNCKTALPRRYVAYLRVSTTRQGQSGLGLEAQREAVTRYVEQVGGVLADEVVEVESGKLKDRPGLRDALQECRVQSATLVIARLDRLARNVAFVSSLMDGGVEFVAVDAPYANRLMLHILAAFAEHERDMVSARTKAALQAAKARGVKLGVNGARLAAIRKAEAITFARKMAPAVEAAKAAGCSTLAQIAASLNAQGCRTRAGARWCPATTRRVMLRLVDPR
ncbi:MULTISPECIES: recombinase family protein [unclassified Brevundimonas]|jgi:DNA invertase Pin-like site-specific DNA recombinase|uniref:recombinase family protein n=1 Tax=unclassified Brevundimonas TaxID=2622653 RepID=UPI000C6A2BAA|nr:MULTISPECIES: recombinase family protein [unclassified Brevundimonas]MAL89155.1 resolvase [Brevundimonas sp.]HAJ04151.1 resolvase [Brevundimonas sp.]HAV49674.1 resolvase [Brevundimonas sp.]